MSHGEDRITRRSALASGAGGAIGGWLATESGASVLAGEQATGDKGAAVSNIYETLGVRTIINAAGTITALGGSLMPPEVQAAWQAAAQSFVPLAELQDRVGEKIAARLGVEAALVTTGAAGGLQLATAAAITLRDPALVERLPISPEQDLQVIRQTAHRDCYDMQLRSCGVRLVDVETKADLERAITKKTVMFLSYNFREGESRIPQSEWIEVALRHKIPTLLDAAADTPPVDALSKFNRLGFDMVVFSGGKALRGPQDAGLLLGRKDLIEQAKRNTSPRCGTIGRGLKVSKEDMVAMWAAVERFVNLDHQAEQREWERRIAVIEAALRAVPTMRFERITPPIANRVPHLLLHWDEQRLGLTPAQVKERLAAGEPSIVTARVHGTGDMGFLVSVFLLKPHEAEVVADRLRQVFSKQS